jgi:hypothetical protein
MLIVPKLPGLLEIDSVLEFIGLPLGGLVVEWQH